LGQSALDGITAVQCSCGGATCKTHLIRDREATYSNLRFYCPLNGGQSPPTDNTRQGTLLGIHLLKQMDTQDPHAHHFGCFHPTVSQARVSEISSFISGIHLLCKRIRKTLTPIISAIFIPMFRRPEFRCCRVHSTSKSLHSSSTYNRLNCYSVTTGSQRLASEVGLNENLNMLIGLSYRCVRL